MKKYFLISLLWLIVVSCATFYPVANTATKNISVEQTIADENPELIEMLKPYKQNLEADMSRVLATCDVEMVKNKPESNMTNFMADMLLEQGQKYSRQKGIEHPVVAYVNYGGIRSILPKGEINVQKVFELMPFENTMVLLKISGEKFMQMANIIAEREGDGIAGMKLGIKDKKVGSLQIAGEKFDPAKSYWIVTNDYVASGGDNMNMFADPESMVSSEITIRDLIIDYMENKTKNGQHISAQKDGRIFYE